MRFRWCTAAAPFTLCRIQLFHPLCTVNQSWDLFEAFLTCLSGDWRRGWVNFSSFLDVSFSFSFRMFFLAPSFSRLASPSHLPLPHPLPLSIKPHCHSGSFPELLLSLVSNWRPSAKQRPAVSYGFSGPVRPSFRVSLSRPASHAASHLSVMLCGLLVNHWHGAGIRDVITVLTMNKMGSSCGLMCQNHHLHFIF